MRMVALFVSAMVVFFGIVGLEAGINRAERRTHDRYQADDAWAGLCFIVFGLAGIADALGLIPW